MLILVCTVLLVQGLPAKIDPPREDSRMLLTAPSWRWAVWYKFMGTPPERRRAAFDKLPPEHQRAIIFEHLGQVRQRYGHKFTQAEKDAVSQFMFAAEPAAFPGDENARDKFWRAHAHLLKTFSVDARKDMEALFPEASKRPMRRED